MTASDGSATIRQGEIEALVQCSFTYNPPGHGRLGECSGVSQTQGRLDVGSTRP
jgi:hypothetical protein